VAPPHKGQAVLQQLNQVVPDEAEGQLVKA
jgi:hypothetical protein